MILSGFALKTLENQLPRLLKNEQNDTVLQSEFDICTEQELKNKNNKKKKKKKKKKKCKLGILFLLML